MSSLLTETVFTPVEKFSALKLVILCTQPLAISVLSPSRTFSLVAVSSQNPSMPFPPASLSDDQRSEYRSHHLARAAEKLIAAGAAGDRVIARAAVKEHLVGNGGINSDLVVPVAAVDQDILVGARRGERPPAGVADNQAVNRTRERDEIVLG